ncbi:MAG TPA: hypothetical protein VF434_04940, partial [Promineifilum sp.]
MLNDRKATDITLINHVVEAARGGSMRAAKGELLNALAADPNNVGAWWLMSIIAETPELRRLYLYQVLYLSPNHEQAKQQLRRLNNDGSDPLLSYLTDKEEREAVDTPAADQPVVEPPRVTGSIDEIAPANESPAGESGDLPDMDDEVDEATAYFIFQSDEEPPRPVADDGSGAAIAGPAADEPAEPVPPEWPPPAANGHFSPANQFPATDAYANGDTARMQAAAATTAPPGDQTAAAAGLPFQQTLLKRGLGLLDGTGERTKTLLFAVFYLILLTAAELLTVFVFVRVGALLHALTLLMLLAHTVRRMGSPDHRLWAAISLVPLIRIVSLTLPLDD